MTPRPRPRRMSPMPKLTLTVELEVGTPVTGVLRGDDDDQEEFVGMLELLELIDRRVDALRRATA